jgi:heme/copper-type cytochrome/quinol oxidase subunit 2
MVKRRDFLKGMLLGATAIIAPGKALAQETGADVKEFHIKLTRYKFTPSVIRVHQGDKVRLMLEGMDLEHGFYIDDYDLDVKVRHAELKTLEFVADKAGAYRIRCSVTCGPLHPFMTGKLVVEPNNRFWAATGLSLVTPFAALLFMHLRNRRQENGD